METISTQNGRCGLEFHIFGFGANSGNQKMWNRSLFRRFQVQAFFNTSLPSTKFAFEYPGGSHVPNPATSRLGRPRLLGAAFAAWLIASSAALAQPTNVPAPPEPTGEWLVAKQSRESRSPIATAGCGAWWPGKRSPADRPQKSRSQSAIPPDAGHADPARHGTEQAEQVGGQIYNSEDGHTYSASISLVDPNTLRVQGCFLGFLCGGENWTRVEPPDRRPRFDAARTGKAASQPQDNGSQPSRRRRMLKSAWLRGAFP